MEQNPLTSLYRVVQNRRANPAEGSYTCYLFSQGLDKILKKCGEECAETIIAAKNGILLDTENEYLRPFVSSNRADGAAANPAGGHLCDFRRTQPKNRQSEKTAPVGSQ